MKSSLFSASHLIAGLILTLIVGTQVGCATTGTSATVAPSSNVTRENALSLAQLTAATVGGKVFTVAPTGSMKPTLDESSIVIYRSAAGAPVVHRLYEQIGDRWLVLGDNNPTIDREAVTVGNLLGRVCAIFYTATGAPLEGEAAALAKR